MLYQNKNNLLNSEEDTKQLGRAIAEIIKLNQPFLLCLYGDFGVGKTFISREIIHSLIGEDEIVTSPTFNLLNIYTKNDLSIYHYDLHRLKKLQEIYELDIEQALENHVSLIEWPEIIEDILPKDNRINIEISYDSEGKRKFYIF
jgi:tRNA threonylcarbamoyladenosine biosynthesis protein TsaE